MPQGHGWGAVDLAVNDADQGERELTLGDERRLVQNGHLTARMDRAKPRTFTDSRHSSGRYP